MESALSSYIQLRDDQNGENNLLSLTDDNERSGHNRRSLRKGPNAGLNAGPGSDLEQSESRACAWGLGGG